MTELPFQLTERQVDAVSAAVRNGAYMHDATRAAGLSGGEYRRYRDIGLDALQRTDGFNPSEDELLCVRLVLDVQRATQDADLEMLRRAGVVPPS